MEETRAPETAKSSISRRELLKALAAGGSALAASAFLPERWSSPKVQAGVLPAHAQGTVCPEIFIKDVGLVLTPGAAPTYRAYVNWSPSWDAPPVGLFVTWCNSAVTIIDITYNNDAPPYYSAVIEFDIPPLIMCDIQPVPVRVVVTFSRTCVSEDTFDLDILIDR